MKIDSVKLRYFRNYEHAYVELSPGVNLITGNNAQGKTNFLEALVYLSLTRSHRINDEKKLICDGHDSASVSCVFEDETQKEIEAVIYNKGKTLMVHHQPVHRASEFIGLLNTVLFSPDDLTLFHDAPGRRRKLINQEISKVSAKYIAALSHFQSLLKDRNLLLKQDHINQTLLDTLDEEMSKEEAVITTMRREFTELVNQRIGMYYHKLSIDADTNLSVRYACAYEETAIEGIRKKHHDTRERDLLYHTTTCGIHREDIVFEMNGQNITEYASQGQKRMAVLSFKMSLLNYIEIKTGKKPVLLLDDVLSELDEQRQAELLKMVDGPYQCIITATEVPAYLKGKNVTEFHVENGTIERTGV